MPQTVVFIVWQRDIIRPQKGQVQTISSPQRLPGKSEPTIILHFPTEANLQISALLPQMFCSQPLSLELRCPFTWRTQGKRKGRKVLCWFFQREKKKLRTIHGTANAVGVGASQSCQSSRGIYCHISELSLLPNNFGFRKINFTTSYLNYMSNEPDTKQQPDCDSSLGVTAAVIRARLSVTLLTETLARSPLCFWVTCSFTFCFSAIRKQIESLCTPVSPSRGIPQSFFAKWNKPSAPCVVSWGLDSPAELQPWTHLI